MTIRIIKKVNLKTVELKAQEVKTQTPEAVIQGWVAEAKANKEAQAQQARKFWGI